MAMKPIPKLIVIVSVVGVIGFGINKTFQLSNLAAPTPTAAQPAAEQTVSQPTPSVERPGVVYSEAPRPVPEPVAEVPAPPAADASQDRGLKHLLRN